LNAACKNNMRQLGIALTLYAGETRAFPYAVAWGPRQFWYDQLAVYYASNKAILGCPAFKGDKDVSSAATWKGDNFFYYNAAKPGYTAEGVSYGYNGYGLRSTGYVYTDSSEVLGLGGSLPAIGGIGPVRDFRVKAPAVMIAMGDSMFMPVVSSTTFSYLLAVGDGARPSPDRHNGGSNMAFVDGHSENILNKRLIENSQSARSRWNNDNEPHMEVKLP